MDGAGTECETASSSQKEGSLTRMTAVSEHEARRIRRIALWLTKRRYGYVPGIVKVGLVDLAVGFRMGGIYNHLHLRKSSPMTRLQREMLAVVVNGHVNGAP